MIKINFCGTRRYYLCASTELYKVEVPTSIMGLDDAIGVAKDLIIHHNFAHVDILDGDTGEVLVEVDNEEEEETPDFSDFFDEVGYNPYLGGYDFDC